MNRKENGRYYMNWSLGKLIGSLPHPLIMHIHNGTTGCFNFRARGVGCVLAPDYKLQS